MQALLNQNGKQLTDANGMVLHVGNLVVDEMFGDGIVRGTVPLASGDGVNVTIQWLGEHDPKTTHTVRMCGSTLGSSWRKVMPKQHA